MVLHPDPHGLFRDLKNLGHVRDQLLTVPAHAELIIAALHLWHRQQQDGTQQVCLDLQLIRVI